MTSKEREALAELRRSKKEKKSGIEKKVIMSSREKANKELNEMWKNISEWSQCGGACVECVESRERFKNRNYREER